MLYTIHAVSAPLTVRDSATSHVAHAPSRRVTYLLGVQTLRHSYSVTSVTQN